MSDRGSRDSWSAEEQLLLALSSPDTHADAVERAFRARLDWARVLRLAAQHQLLTTVADAATRVEALSYLPAAEREQLETIQRHAVFHDRLHVIALGEVLDRFAEAGITCLLLKGQAFAERLYDSPSERVASDIDLLVAEEHLESASRQLETLGFTPVRPELYRQHHFHIPFSHESPMRPIVELHWDLSPETSPIRFDTGSWWPRARAVTLRSGSARVPPAAEELAHFSWHAFNSGTVSLRDLSDILRLWRAAECDDALPSVLSYGQASGTSGFLERGLLLAAELWNLEPPRSLPRAQTATRALLARRLLQPDLVLSGGSRHGRSLRRIAYWSLLPPERASVGFLFSDAVRDMRMAAVFGDTPPRSPEIAATVTKLTLALLLCLLPLPRRFLPWLTSP
jgi:hypothetical protein